LDGYAEESEYVINKHKGIDVITLPENKGMQHALNMGVWNANNEKIFIINDDNVFAPNWDKKLESQYDPNEILTVNQIEPTGPGMFNFPVMDCGQTVETFDMEKFIDEERRLSTNKKTPDGNIFPFLINKKWYMAVGGFDTFYNSPNLCDWDFFAKLELIPIRKHRSSEKENNSQCNNITISGVFLHTMVLTIQNSQTGIRLL